MPRKAAAIATEDMTLVQRTKIGKYNFLVYRHGEREYHLLVKQGSEMLPLIKWWCGHSPDKASFINSVTEFVCQSCPGSRPSKVHAAIGDEIRYTCYAYPIGSKVAVHSSQTAVRELQKLVPSDMAQESSDGLVAHLYAQTPASVIDTDYASDPSAPSYLLEWEDGFQERFDFDFVDSMFACMKRRRAAAGQRASVLEKTSPPPSEHAERRKVRGKR